MDELLEQAADIFPLLLDEIEENNSIPMATICQPNFSDIHGTASPYKKHKKMMEKEEWWESRYQECRCEEQDLELKLRNTRFTDV